MDSKDTMKAAIATQFGNPDDVLSVVNDRPKPPPTDEELLIRVHAVSLSPSDYRVLLGDKTVVANPTTWPYVPGGDVSGVVEHVPESASSGFKVGDRVFSTWSMYGQGGMAQHALVSPDLTVKLPDELSFVEGAALANSASHGVRAVDCANVHPGDRVLVLGGSGGVGTIVVQVLRQRGASYVAATSTDSDLMKELGVDRTINYKKEKWWEVPEFQADPFDVIIDCAVGKEAWKNCGPVLKGKKDGGRFVAVVLEDWHIDGKHIYQIIALLLPPMGRQLANVFRRSSPEYRVYMSVVKKDSMEQVADMVTKKKFKVIVDPRGPFPFTTQGVRDAWNLHIARGGHGKIVIAID